MKSCHWCKNRVSSYLEGDLGAEEIAQFELHTESCLDCAEEVNMHQRLMQTLRAIPERVIEVSAFQKQLHQKLAKAKLEQQISNRKLRLEAAACPVKKTLPYILTWRNVAIATTAAIGFFLIATPVSHVENSVPQASKQLQPIVFETTSDDAPLEALPVIESRALLKQEIRPGEGHEKALQRLEEERIQQEHRERYYRQQRRARNPIQVVNRR